MGDIDATVWEDEDFHTVLLWLVGIFICLLLAWLGLILRHQILGVFRVILSDRREQKSSQHPSFVGDARNSRPRQFASPHSHLRLNTDPKYHQQLARPYHRDVSHQRVHPISNPLQPQQDHRASVARQHNYRQPHPYLISLAHQSLSQLPQPHPEEMHWQWVSTGKPPTPVREFRGRSKTIVGSSFRARLFSLRNDQTWSRVSNSASVDSIKLSIGEFETPSNAGQSPQQSIPVRSQQRTSNRLSSRKSNRNRLSSCCSNAGQSSQQSIPALSQQRTSNRLSNRKLKILLGRICVITDPELKSEIFHLTFDVIELGSWDAEEWRVFVEKLFSGHPEGAGFIADLQRHITGKHNILKGACHEIDENSKGRMIARPTRMNGGSNIASDTTITHFSHSEDVDQDYLGGVLRFFEVIRATMNRWLSWQGVVKAEMKDIYEALEYCDKLDIAHNAAVNAALFLRNKEGRTLSDCLDPSSEAEEAPTTSLEPPPLFRDRSLSSPLGDIGRKIWASGGDNSLSAAGEDNRLSAPGGDNSLSGVGGDQSLSAAGPNYQSPTPGTDSSLFAAGGYNSLTAKSGDISLSVAGEDASLSAAGGDNSLSTAGGDNSLSASSGDLDKWSMVVGVNGHRNCLSAPDRGSCSGSSAAGREDSGTFQRKSNLKGESNAEARTVSKHVTYGHQPHYGPHQRHGNLRHHAHPQQRRGNQQHHAHPQQHFLNISNEVHLQQSYFSQNPSRRPSTTSICYDSIQWEDSNMESM